MDALDRLRTTWIDLKGIGRLLPQVPKLNPRGQWNSARLLHDLARRLPNQVGLAFLDHRWTWQQIDEHANQWADFFVKHGIGHGDVVALVMDNRPDFLFIMGGLSRVRAIGALINHHLSGKPLAHAINVAKPKGLIAGSEHLEPVLEVLPELEAIVPEHNLWVHVDEWGAGGRGGRGRPADGEQRTANREQGTANREQGTANREQGTANAEQPRANSQQPAAGTGEGHQARGGRVVNDEVAACSRHELPNLAPPQTLEPMCYIYTSGTTGLPKAAIITNQRFLMASTMFGCILGEATPGDTVYMTLPLYHSNGMFGGWGATLLSGAALALRRKFSASNFWKDVRDFDATVFIYIGELCRYLLNHTSTPDERDHRLRLGIGNGLRPDIWEKFQARFGVPLIREFYGATEGNAPLMNLEGRQGMVGRLRSGQIIVQCDPSTGEVIRNAQGRCQPVAVGERGLLLGKITNLTRFDGYVDEAATQNKILHDVLAPGDRYFNSGDLMQLHPGSWVSFADRVGDTFRWKGENVSTNEVAETLNGARGVLESNVYGVQVANAEGRCGMASLRVGDDFDLGEFAAYVTRELPSYQRPHFLRLQGDMRVTGTFKHQKVDYREEGYDPHRVADPLYFLDGEHYVRIDEELHRKLTSGEVAPR